MNRIFSSTDRRTSKRMRMNCTVVYRTNEPSTTKVMLGGQDIQAQMLDISQTGMALLTDKDIPISTILSMRFTLLKVDNDVVKLSGPMEALGEVRSNVVNEDHHSHRLGIYFTKMKKVTVA